MQTPPRSRAQFSGMIAISHVHDEPVQRLITPLLELHLGELAEFLPRLVVGAREVPRDKVVRYQRLFGQAGDAVLADAELPFFDQISADLFQPLGGKSSALPSPLTRWGCAHG